MGEVVDIGRAGVRTVGIRLAAGAMNVHRCGLAHEGVPRRSKAQAQSHQLFVHGIGVKCPHARMREGIESVGKESGSRLFMRDSEADTEVRHLAPVGDGCITFAGFLLGVGPRLLVFHAKEAEVVITTPELREWCPRGDQVDAGSCQEAAQAEEEGWMSGDDDARQGALRLGLIKPSREGGNRRVGRDAPPGIIVKEFTVPVVGFADGGGHGFQGGAAGFLVMSNDKGKPSSLDGVGRSSWERTVRDRHCDEIGGVRIQEGAFSAGNSQHGDGCTARGREGMNAEEAVDVKAKQKQERRGAHRLRPSMR